jgi:hypothetical protein
VKLGGGVSRYLQLHRLCLPYHKGLGCCQEVTSLEYKGGELRTVMDREKEIRKEAVVRWEIRK